MRDLSGIHGPYWLRAHKDWRFLAVVFLMLAAILTYVLTMDLSLRPRRIPDPAAARTAAGKL